MAEVIDLDRPVYAVYHVFDVAAQAEKMRASHPDWTERQLRNSRLWQHTAQAGLKTEIAAFLSHNPGYLVVPYPEAAGVNVTATMALAGINLQWPPKTTVYKIALAGEARQGRTPPR